MKIIISNAVTLNGGDYAIVESITKVLKKTYGENIEFIIYDSHAEIASKYHYNLNYRNSIFHNYKKRAKGIVRKVFVALINKTYRMRFMLAAKLFSGGFKFRKLINLVLSKEQIIDFNNYVTADLIVATGGTYLVETYSLKSRIWDYQFTLALNKPLIFFTQSLGPFKIVENQKSLKQIFNQARLILLRDEVSLSNIKEIGVDVSKVKVCADVVFADTDEFILESAKLKNIEEPLKVAISVRDWKYFDGKETTKGMEDYLNSIIALCEYITHELQGEVLFISTCQAIDEYSYDDSKTAKNIFNSLSQKAQSKIIVDNTFHTPTEFKDIVQEYDLLIATRMHAAIQSLSVGIPVLPIAYEFKTKELFKKLIDRKYILDIATINELHALKTFKEFIAELPYFRSQLMSGVIKEHNSALMPIQFLKENVNINSELI